MSIRYLSSRLMLAASLCMAPAIASALPLPAGNQPALRIQGSNTIGANLAPELLSAMLSDRGFRNIRVVSTSADEIQVTATSPEGRTASFTLASHGSSTGFDALAQGTADLAASSRPVKSDELSALNNQRNKHTEHVIAIDGLAIITHPDNPIDSLSVEQLARVFSGEIRDWKELGNFSGPVHLYARDEHSGTWDTFQSLVLGDNKPLSQQARRFESSEQLSDLVSRDPQGIGFIGLPYIRNAKAMAISSGNSQSMLPSAELVASEDYPLSRRLFLYTPPESSAWAKALAEYAHTDKAQKIVAQNGFVPQKVLAMQVAPSSNMPEGYRTLASSARRLNATFRFAEGSSELDSKAMRDVERVVEFLKEHEKLEGKVVLVGFDEPRGDSTRSMLISRLRAIAVQRHLSRAGVLVKDNLGMGDVLPVADNSSASGRARNHRVEVWVY